MWIRIENVLINTDKYVNFCIEKENYEDYSLYGYR